MSISYRHHAYKEATERRGKGKLKGLVIGESRIHISFVGYIKVTCLLQDAAPLQGDINLEQENVNLYQLRLEKIYHNLG